MYSFDAKLAEGQHYEAVLDAFFRRRGATVLEATRAEQRRGIDRWIDGEAVEYKADRTASRTGNCFIETVSVDTANKPGWAYTSEADWLFYFLPESELLYIVWMRSLRWELVGWEKSCRTVKVPNDGYHTHGLLVPQSWIEGLAKEVVNGVQHGTH